VKLSLLLSYNLRSVLQRWRTSLLAVFGIGLVVGVLGWLFAMSSGLRETLKSTGLQAQRFALKMRIRDAERSGNLEEAVRLTGELGQIDRAAL